MWIENRSLDAVRRGIHRQPNENDILIQITSPDTPFPDPAFPFKEVHRFHWDDVNGLGHEDGKNTMITQEEADHIIAILDKAFKEEKNVIVHCHAGISRSGAVVDIGVIMGFACTPNIWRHPNIEIRRELLYAYDRHLLKQEKS